MRGVLVLGMLIAEDCAQHGQARLDVEAGNVLWVGGAKRLLDQIFHGSGPLEDGAHGVGEVIC